MSAPGNPEVIPELGPDDDSADAATREHMKRWQDGEESHPGEDDEPEQEWRIGDDRHPGDAVYSATRKALPGLTWVLDPDSETRPATEGEQARYGERRNDPGWSWLYGDAEPVGFVSDWTQRERDARIEAERELVPVPVFVVRNSDGEETMRWPAPETDPAQVRMDDLAVQRHHGPMSGYEDSGDDTRVQTAVIAAGKPGWRRRKW